MWLDDLFPKARFLDALAMVEKTGHKRLMTTSRLEWINEGRRKTSGIDAGDNVFDALEIRPENSKQTTQPAHKETHNGTKPAAPAPAEVPSTPPRASDIPDDDDLYDHTPGAKVPGPSLIPAKPPQNSAPADDDDDLDALIAEAEVAEATRPQTTNELAVAARPGDDGFADEEAAMAEMGHLW